MSINATLASAMANAVANPNLFMPQPEERAAVITPPQFQHHAAPQIKTLADKAMLVKLTRRMFSPYAYDEEATRAAESSMGVTNVGRFNKHLFKRAGSKVREVNKLFSDAYIYHKRHTLPWDNGVDLLKADLYMSYTAEMRQRIDACTEAVLDLAAVWDQEVADDMQHLGAMAKLEDYPTDITKFYGIDVRFRPVPSAGDFRVGISDEDLASLEKDILEAEQNAAKHVIVSMLEPMQAAAKRLTEYRGDKGQRFHDSTITNMLEVADRMAVINLSDDPAVAERINDLRALVGTYAKNIDVLRESETVRQTAKQQIKALMQQMEGLV